MCGRDSAEHMFLRKVIPTLMVARLSMTFLNTISWVVQLSTAKWNSCSTRQGVDLRPITSCLGFLRTAVKPVTTFSAHFAATSFDLVFVRLLVLSTRNSDGQWRWAAFRLITRQRNQRGYLTQRTFKLRGAIASAVIKDGTSAGRSSGENGSNWIRCVRDHVEWYQLVVRIPMYSLFPLDLFSQQGVGLQNPI